MAGCSLVTMSSVYHKQKTAEIGAADDIALNNVVSKEDVTYIHRIGKYNGIGTVYFYPRRQYFTSIIPNTIHKNRDWIVQKRLRYVGSFAHFNR